MGLSQILLAGILNTMKNTKKMAHDMTDPMWFHRLGGRARMNKMTKKERSDLGRAAVPKRWKNHKK